LLRKGPVGTTLLVVEAIDIDTEDILAISGEVVLAEDDPAAIDEEIVRAELVAVAALPLGPGRARRGGRDKNQKVHTLQGNTQAFFGIPAAQSSARARVAVRVASEHP
jgi:hypothetical protein